METQIQIEQVPIDELRPDPANPQIALIIDMAKAHALDAMGEEDAATQIVKRYL
jgi:hypothetical protein